METQRESVPASVGRMIIISIPPQIGELAEQEKMTVDDIKTMFIQVCVCVECIIDICDAIS